MSWSISWLVVEDGDDALFRGVCITSPIIFVFLIFILWSNALPFPTFYHHCHHMTLPWSYHSSLFQNYKDYNDKYILIPIALNFYLIPQMIVTTTYWTVNNNIFLLFPAH